MNYFVQPKKKKKSPNKKKNKKKIKKQNDKQKFPEWRKIKLLTWMTMKTEVKADQLTKTCVTYTMLDETIKE